MHVLFPGTAACETITRVTKLEDNSSSYETPVFSTAALNNKTVGEANTGEDLYI